MCIANSKSIDFFNYFQQDDSLFTVSHVKQINDYSLCAKIGSGSFSSVYLGVDVHTNAKYAIKRINLRKLAKNGDCVAQLEREIRLMRTFKHPNILKLIEVLHLPISNEAFLVLEYAAKGCLGAFLDRGQKIPVQSVLSIVKQLANALACLHDTGYVHQDIKPWNILIDGHGRAILADFGIGHSFGSASMVIGSPAYQAPEALDDAYCDDDGVDSSPQKEDVWALGVTFFHLLFQRLPFAGESLFEIVNSIREVGLKIPEETDQGITEILTGMLKIDPNERWGIQELLGHPLIQNADDRAKNLPPVPALRMRDGIVKAVEATVCSESFSFSDVLCSIGRRSSFGGTDTHCGPGLTRAKSAPSEQVHGGECLWDFD